VAIPWRPQARGLTWADVLLPLGLAILAVLEMAGVHPDGWQWAAGVEVLMAALLIWRRHAALVVAPAACVILVQLPWIGPQLDEVSVPILYLVVSGYSLARWVAGYRGLVGVAVILSALFVTYATVDPRAHGPGDVVFVLTLLVPPYVLGTIVRRLDERTRQLRAAEAVVRREAARDERDRIARELHDVIAHSVSAMVVQTAAAQDLIRSDPDRAEQVLADVAATGRQALSETGRLLHVVRDSDDELGLAPAPGLADVPALVERFRADGLEVDLALDLSDPAPAIPSGVDISAYRIVQEALTNALRYAPDRAARIRLSATPERVAIAASNASAGRTGSGSGLGLLGMAERVSVLGGTLTHGTDPAGRFRLDATLPVSS
jgi:signal transduction histidine kinase